LEHAASELTKVSISAAVNRSVVADSWVPIPDDDFLEMPARYPTLNAPFDMFRTLVQLTT